MLNFINFVKILFKRYFIDSIFLNIHQIAGIFVTLITLPIILANLPMEDYGKLQFIFALQLWLVTLTAGYATMGAKRGIAKGLDGTFLFAFFSRLKFLLIIGLIGFIASFFIYSTGLVTLSLLLVIMSSFLVLGYLPQVSYPEFFVAKKQFKNFAVWRTIASTLVPLASAVTAFLTHNILIYAIIQFGLTALISLVAFFYVIVKNNLISTYKKGEIDKTCFFYGMKLIPASLVFQTSNKMTNFIIGPFFGFTNLAVFSIASKLQEQFSGFSKTLYNLFYSDFARDERDRLIKKIKSKLKQGMIISIFITLGFVLAGYLYIYLFLPQSYQPTKIYFLILSLGLPAIILQIILHTVLSANLRYKELTVLLILPNLIKIFLIILLGLLFKVIGICFGVVFGAWISFGFYYFLVMKKDLALKLINKSPLLKKLSNF